MTTEQLESQWNAISPKGASPYRSLRINSDSIPEIYLALDISGYRFVILEVPAETKVSCNTVKLENLSLEWYPETHYILIGLRNNKYSDLFNDLTLSLYNRIENLDNPKSYTEEFVNTFYKWAAFFENFTAGLSENSIKGLFGELIVLKWYLENQKFAVNDLLKSWQGPFNSAQDFIFPRFNLEVKTKNHLETNVGISGEFQLEEEEWKGLQLAVVNVNPEDDGRTISFLINEIKHAIQIRAGDLSIFASALARMGLNFTTADNYDSYKWRPKNITIYDCSLRGFPRITSVTAPQGVSQVKYSLNTSILESFIIQRIILTWS